MIQVITADASYVANELKQAYISALAYHLLTKQFIVDLRYSEVQVVLKYMDIPTFSREFCS